MSEKKKSSGLGRGLSALLAEARITPEADSAPTVAPTAAAPAGTAPQTLPLSAIVANARQPRRRFDDQALADLTASVRERGLLQPILVRPVALGRYEIVAGERRWRAAQAAQLHDVPVIVRPLTDSEAFEIALVENVQRADLNAIEEASGYRRLIDDYGHTQEELARLIGKSRSHIANLLRLLDLPQAIRDLVIDGQISMGHARALVGAAGAHELARRVVAEGLSVRALERLVADEGGKGRGKREPRGKAAGPAADADTAAIEAQLQRISGLRTRITFDGKGAGTVTFSYSSLDQLDMLCNRIMGSRI